MQEDRTSRPEFSRRRLFGMSAAAGLVAAGIGSLAACDPSTLAAQANNDTPPPTGRLVSAPSPNGVLGANFNGDPNVMTIAELRNITATWVRGFFAMPDADKGNAADQPAIKALITYAGQATAPCCR